MKMMFRAAMQKTVTCSDEVDSYIAIFLAHKPAAVTYSTEKDDTP
jgi:hypothetical protein